MKDNFELRISNCGLSETVNSAAQMSADEVRAELVQKIQEWCLGASQHDDLTFVVLKVKFVSIQRGVKPRSGLQLQFNPPLPKARL